MTLTLISRPTSASLRSGWSRARALVLICLLVAGLTPVRAQDSLALVEYLPGEKIFPRFTADGREHQMSLSAITKNREWIGAVGASVPVIQVNPRGTTLQASVAATIFNRLVKTPGHLTVYTIDYKVDLPFDLRISRLAIRTGLGHISCHFADDALELYGERSIQHVNDYIILGVAYDVPGLQGYLYARANYSYGTQPVPDRPWLLQFGGDLGNIPLFQDVAVYGAFDIKVKEETGWGSTQSYQAGVKLFAHGSRQLRLAYTLRLGYDERGQFYLDRDTLQLISVFLDL